MAATFEGLSEVLNAFDNLAGIAKDPDIENAFLLEAEDFKDVIITPNDMQYIHVIGLAVHKSGDI